MMTTDGKPGDMLSQNCIFWIINQKITLSCVQTLPSGYLLFNCSDRCYSDIFTILGTCMCDADSCVSMSVVDLTGCSWLLLLGSAAAGHCF